MAKKTINREFQYDTLVDRCNICDRKSETAAIGRMISRGQKVVIYAPRRYGKTSLMQNVLAADFLETHKGGFLFYVDFMDVIDLSSIEQRLTQSISKSLRSKSPVRGFFESMANYFKNLSLTFDIDPMTGQPSASIKGQLGKEQKTIEEYFAALFNISKQHPVLLVLDEFQDIKFVPQAEGILRSHLQRITKIPTLISGSKRQLLTEMFASAHAPFFSFGDEISLPPIPVSDWHEYFNIRLQAHNKSISIETLGEICERLCHVPNAISEVGFWFRHDANLSGIISSSDAWNSIHGLLQGKQQTYRYHLAPYSIKEKAILHAVAKRTYVSAPNSNEFIKDVMSNASSISKSIDKFIRLGVLEWELDMGYRISDPLLSLFIAKNPPRS